MLIKGFEKEQEQGFNENTLKWKGKTLKEMHHKELIDVIVHLFQSNLAMQAELKKYERITKPRIIQPYS